MLYKTKKNQLKLHITGDLSIVCNLYLQCAFKVLIQFIMKRKKNIWLRNWNINLLNKHKMCIFVKLYINTITNERTEWILAVFRCSTSAMAVLHYQFCRDVRQMLKSGFRCQVTSGDGRSVIWWRICLVHAVQGAWGLFDREIPTDSYRLKLLNLTNDILQ